MSGTFEYDDLFLYLPSFLLAERMEAAGALVEGKALGTAKEQDLILAQDIGKQKDYHWRKFANERKKGATVGKRRLKQVKEQTFDALIGYITDYTDGKIGTTELRKRSTATMKESWRKVFLAGLRAGGTRGQGKGAGKELIKLSEGDDKWLKSAMQHEMRFLNKFMGAIEDDTWKMPIERRARMYVEALESFYNSARVIALPSNVVIRWAGPNDKKSCPGCQYLFAHNPYTKANLPTTPRAGSTPCLTHCRDRLMVRRVTADEAEQVTEASQYNRTSHVKNLRRIKRVGHL